METIISWITSASGIITIIVIILSALIFIGLKRGIKKFVKKTNTGTTILVGAIKYVVIATCAIIVLDVNGVHITKVIAGLGVASIIIGFALQDALKDIIMSIHILIDDFYKVGDVIKFDNIEGNVINFTLRTTKIKSIDTSEIYSISNREIYKVIKSSGVCDILLPMPYEEDPDEMHELMTHICSKFESVEHVSMAEFMGTQEFNDSSISYKLRFRCNPMHKPQARRDCLFIIQECLKEAGKAIPYNQLDIHRKD